MNYEQLNGKSIREGFLEFHSKNPHVYKAFEKQALIAINKGRTKLSAKMIINWIRWNEFLRTSDLNFCINDAFTPLYSRLFIDRHKEYDGIFEMRKLRNEHKGSQVMRVDEKGQIEFF